MGKDGHTHHYGEFDSIKETDTPEVAIEKAVGIQNGANGDVHGLDVDQIDLSPDADVAGAEESKNAFGAMAFETNHTSQADLIAINAGSNAEQHGDTQAKVREEAKQNRQDNQNFRMALVAGIAFSAAQQRSFDNFRDAMNRLRRETQEAEEVIADTAEDLQATIEAYNNGDISEAEYNDRMSAASMTLAGINESRAQALEAVREPILELSENLDGQEFNGRVLEGAEVVEAYNTLATSIEEGREPDLSGFASLPPDVANQMFIAMNIDPDVAMATISRGGSTTALFEQAGFISANIPASEVDLAAQVNANIRLEDQQEFDALTSLAASTGTDGMPAETIAEIGAAFLAAEEPDLDSIANLPQEVQDLLVESRYPGAQIPADLASLEGVEPSAPNLSAIEHTGMVCTQTAGEADMFNRSLSEGGGFVPAGFGPATVTDLQQPRDFATVSAMLDVENTYGTGRGAVTYPNGLVADGAFHDARVGSVTPPDSEARPVPGTPTYDRTATARPGSFEDMQPRDPMMSMFGGN